MPVSNPVTNYATAAATAATFAAVGGYYAYQLYRDHKKSKLPEEWVHIGHLKHLRAYPIKSCAPIDLKEAECAAIGLKVDWLRDRIMMVLDAEDNNFITARAYPELLKIKPSFKKAILTLEHNNMGSIEVNLAEVMLTQKPMQAKVWISPVPVYDCGQEVNDWITKCLALEGRTFRLAYYASQNSRKSTVDKIFDRCRTDDAGTLGDEMAYNVINEASVDDLNTRLTDTKVSYINFRPNFVVSGAQPYDEDKWKYIKIGENIFEIIKPCTRCVLTTIDPETGVRDKKMEPLETLRKYRLAEGPAMLKVLGNSPRMGMQIALRSGPGGVISLNDPVSVAY